MSQLYAMVQNYGSPSYFVTVAMDESSSVLNIRLSSEIHDNSDFTAIEKGLQDAILKEFEAIHGVDLTPNGLSKLIAENPVSAAMVFEHVLDVLLHDLLKVPGQRCRKRKMEEIESCNRS